MFLYIITILFSLWCNLTDLQNYCFSLLYMYVFFNNINVLSISVELSSGQSDNLQILNYILYVCILCEVHF